MGVMDGRVWKWMFVRRRVCRSEGFLRWRVGDR